MDEYLFFQQHKRLLRDNSSILSPKIFSSKKSDLDNNQVDKYETVRNSFPKVQFVNAPQNGMNFMPSPPVRPPSKVDANAAFPAEVELNDDTMKGCLKELSGKYTDQYVSSGFPPKICSLILKELLKDNRLKVQVLDVGCGKGHVGEYLREDGFLHITGLDCSKNLLQVAQEKKAYERLEKVVFGQEGAHPDHTGKYDVVISASMINNDGWDVRAFQKLLSYVKMGGFIIFTTKLDLNQENQYAADIDQLSGEQHWKFVTEHTFYRYDKLCGGQGKFSNKLVKIVAYQKTDHNEYLVREKDRLEMEAILEQQRLADIEFRIRQKEEKLNKNQNDRANRKRAIEKQAEDEANAELMAQQEVEADVEQQKLSVIRQKEQREMMMNKLKTFIQNAMWIKLKAIKKQEEDALELRRVEAEKKRKEGLAKLKLQQSMMMKKVPYDSDDEAADKSPISPSFRAKTNLLDQKHPA